MLEQIFCFPHARTHTEKTHKLSLCFSVWLFYIAKRSSKHSPQRLSALLPENSSKSWPWSGVVGGQFWLGQGWFKKKIEREKGEKSFCTLWSAIFTLNGYMIFSDGFLSLSLCGCAAACGPHLFIRCEFSKSHLMTAISAKPREAAHSICSALKVSRLLMVFGFVNMLPAAPDGLER